MTCFSKPDGFANKDSTLIKRWKTGVFYPKFALRFHLACKGAAWASPLTPGPVAALFFASKNVIKIAVSVIGIYPCPDGWTPSLSNMCLKISSTAKTWDLAWMDCLGQGGELLTLETKEKSIYIKGWLNDKGNNSYLF